MTAADAARLNQAFNLLRHGRTQEAMSIASDVASRSPNSADALHLLALCRRGDGDDAGATAAFERARHLAPNDPRLLGNNANHLRRIGELAQAIELHRRALAITPENGEGWMNLGLTLIDTSDAAGACEALERAVALRPESSAAWQALGAARRVAGNLDGAEQALRQAVALDANNGAAWINLGVIRRLLGDATQALECYGRARRAGFAGPQIDDAEASAHLDLGEPRRALELARRLVSEAPTYLPGHTLLAHVLWEHGAALAPHENPMAAFRAAVAAQREHRPLRMEFTRLLLEAGAAEEALPHLRALRAQADTPALMAHEAHALEMLGDARAAGTLFAQAHTLAAPADAGLLNLYVRHLLKSGEAEHAATRAQEALEREPHNQPALAYLGVAWRLLGDAREHWLCDYGRLVSEISVDLPPDFLRALDATLTSMHTARREPIDQSLRGGSQTSGVLFGRRDPLIAELRESLARAVAGYVASLPEDTTHPFLGRKSPRIRFSGSWSVRLASAGRHVNHFHQQGWISSAFYVSLPPTVARPPAESQAGFLQFGEPPVELGLSLGPRRVVRPREGRLVLFPSYFWHGTVPFEDETPRLAVAFDAVPAPISS
jgi:Flp pilus assembly protein TadD